MKSSASIAGRAVLALVLMAGFYLLALSIALGLLYIPYAEIAYGNRIYFRLTILCVIGALAILWSVIPRVDRFKPPGPRLTRERHPRLFAEIEAVARSVEQPPPAEVYLVPDVNAWVSQRGGLMGFGSRRVMGLGLALMRVLTRSQLRAVLAHEFGHYHGGDTKLGPWIYKTRGAIGRTLESLAKTRSAGVFIALLQLPFLWYGRMFLRITHAVSRRQEFLADELAARTVGSQPLIEGLRTVHGTAPSFGAYWAHECVPVLQAGFHPPLAEGFERFVHSGAVSALISANLDAEMKGGQTDPYDTHPPLKERIAAVAGLPPGATAGDDPPAISLLDGGPELEHELLAALAGEELANALKPIGWSDVCAKVYRPRWTQLILANAAALRGLTPESLPEQAGRLQTASAGFVHASGEKPGPDDVKHLGSAVVAAALLLALECQGGVIEKEPQKPFVIRLKGEALEPFGLLELLATQKLPAQEWRDQCARMGVTGLEFGAVVPPPPAPPAAKG